MRPTARRQSAIRNPLNHILGTEANVRVLRAVYLSDIPISVSDLARVTALQKSGVARVCVRLEDLGVIEAVGRGARNRQYRRAGRFPFSGSLSTLFHEERSRAEMIIGEIRQIVQGAGTGLRAAWIEGPVAAGTDAPEDSLDVSVLADSANLELVRTAIWQRLIGIQQLRDVAIHLEVFSLADLETASSTRRERLARVILLAGPAPLDLLQSDRQPAAVKTSHSTRDHALRDEQALALARAIAERIRHDPSVVEDARRYIARRLAAASSGEQLELREWDALLSTKSTARLTRFLTESSEQATRLRQSLPFLDVLSPEERRAILAASGSPT